MGESLSISFSTECFKSKNLFSCLANSKFNCYNSFLNHLVVLEYV